MDLSPSNLNQFGLLGTPSGSIWSRTVGYGAVGPRYRFLTDEQNDAMERVRVGRMLWRGQHRQAFLWEGRSQWNFPPAMVQGRMIIPYVTYNVLRLVTNTINDLLLGDEPMIRVDGRSVSAGRLPPGEGLDGLRDRCDLHKVFRQAADQASWAGTAMVEAVRWAGRVYLQNVKAGTVFPVGPRNPDGQYSQYRRYATAQTREPKPRLLLLVTEFVPGETRRRCHLLGGESGAEIIADAPMDLWPVKGPTGEPLPAVEATGVDAPLIIGLSGQEDEGEVVSDYDGLIELQDELNSKQTQIARVIAKHADPKMALPAQMAHSMTGGSLSAHDVFFFNSREEIPQYVTWNAELAAALADRDFALHALHVAAEVSPVLSGIKQGAAPTAARTLRLEATKSLSLAKRKQAYQGPFIRTCIDTALAYEDAGRAVSVYIRRAGAEQGWGGWGVTSVAFRDGLPVDGQDQATELTTLTGGKAVMSVERAVEILNPDPETAAIELQRIQAQQAAATPPILLGGGATEDGEAAEPVAEDPPLAAGTAGSESEEVTA